LLVVALLGLLALGLGVTGVLSPTVATGGVLLAAVVGGIGLVFGAVIQLGHELRVDRHDRAAAAAEDERRVRAQGRRLAAIEQVLGPMPGSLRRLERVVRAEGQVVPQVSALLDLHAALPVPAPTPLPTRWSATPEVLHLLVEQVLTAGRVVVVECGSGASTVWLGHAVRRVPGGRVIALEHEERFAEATRAVVRAHGLEDVVEVRSAPLEPHRIGEEIWDWYAENAWADLAAVDLLFVDGPPGTGAVQARYPAVPLLAGRLSPDALVVVDDADRADEQAMVQRWLAERPTGVPLVAEARAFGRGVLLVQAGDPQGASGATAG
jgi:predicted O-methyltransferase YrrM